MRNLLFVGLGNPDKEYNLTRHNIGADFIKMLAKEFSLVFINKKKLKGLYSCLTTSEANLHLLIPSVYMNNSGDSVLAAKKYLNIKNNDILIFHDDLDIPAGESRYKLDGGHGGHNGIKDIIQKLQDPSFYRLRIGISHPGKEKDVTNYVLTKPSPNDKLKINESFTHVLTTLPYIAQGEWQEAMLILHSKEKK